MRDRGDRRTAARRLLGMAEELGNVAEACRRMGVDRSAYYRARRVFGAGGRQAAGSGTPPALRERILALCLEHTEWGCDRIAHYLTLTGSPISSPTVQKILIRAGLGRREQREAAARAAGGG